MRSLLRALPWGCLSIAAWLGALASAEAQAPLRIGASFSNTGSFKVDRDGFQIAHKTLIIQWQDGKKVIVWPEELAPDTPRFPTPPWSQRP